MGKTFCRLLAGLLLLTLSAQAAFGAEAEVKAAPEVSRAQIFVAPLGDVPRLVQQTEGVLAQPVVRGSVVYFPIEGAARAEDLQGMRALVDGWENGQSGVDTPRIEYRMMYDATGQEALGYRYVVALPVEETAGQEEERHVVAKVFVGPRWSNSRAVSFSFWIYNPDGNSTQANSLYCKEIPSNLLEFEQEEEALLLEFPDVATFAIDAYQQGRVNVGFSTRPLTDVVLAYPEADLRFACWEHNPIFVREGELFLYADDTELLYEVTPSGLRPLEAEYDSERGAFRFSTRRLGCYVFSNRELGAPHLPEEPYNPLTNGPNLVEQAE